MPTSFAVDRPSLTLRLKTLSVSERASALPLAVTCVSKCVTRV
jgi:hypothetical protein